MGVVGGVLVTGSYRRLAFGSEVESMAPLAAPGLAGSAASELTGEGVGLVISGRVVVEVVSTGAG